MATETDQPTVTIPELNAESMLAQMSTVKRMLMVGALFAVVGYLLVGSALVLELTQFHPALDAFFANNPSLSLAGGGPERSAAASSAVATVNKWPSLLLWLKLGGVAHILLGIFIALAAIVRTLSLVPHRLAYELSRD